MQAAPHPPTPAPPWSALAPSAAVTGRLRRAAAVAGFALGITVAQTLLACALSGAADPTAAYHRLSQWDSKWYARLAEHGYPDAMPAAAEDMPKIGFFPGYPLVAWLVTCVTGLSAASAILLTAQLAAWGFWAYVLLFLQRWQVPAPLAVAAVLAVAVHPCAFFLVAGYSESLFLLAVLGFLYWSSTGTRTGWLLAALHGVLLTATRIVGLPLAVVPLIVVLFAQPGNRLARLFSAAGLCAAASLGGLLFFAFCQLQLGRWDAYLVSQRAHWGVQPDYLALFRPDVYQIGWPTFLDGGSINPNYLSRMCVPLTVLLLLALLLVEARLAKHDRAGTWRQRAGFYLCGAFMFFIAVSGLANSNLVSMIRYTFCVHVMLCLAVAHLLMRFPLPQGYLRTAAVGLLGGTAAVSAACQLMLAYLFTHGEWVA